MKQDDPVPSTKNLRARESLAEYLIRRAQEEGKFDNLEGAGKPLEILDEQYEDGWWVKRLVQRERLKKLIPPG